MWLTHNDSFPIVLSTKREFLSIKAHIRAIESEKRVGHWVEEAIEEKLAREQKKIKQKEPGVRSLSGG